MRSVVEDFKTTKNKIGPYLLDVLWGTDIKNKTYGLSVFYYDETETLIGFCVREYDSVGDLILKEVYPIYPHGIAGTPHASDINVVVRPRSPGQRKDEDAWAEYVAKAEPPCDALPTVYMTQPGEEVIVKLSLIDMQGNESEALEVLTVQQYEDEAP